MPCAITPIGHFFVSAASSFGKNRNDTYFMESCVVGIGWPDSVPCFAELSDPLTRRADRADEERSEVEPPFNDSSLFGMDDCSDLSHSFEDHEAKMSLQQQSSPHSLPEAKPRVGITSESGLSFICTLDCDELTLKPTSRASFILLRLPEGAATPEVVLHNLPTRSVALLEDHTPAEIREESASPELRVKVREGDLLLAVNSRPVAVGIKLEEVTALAAEAARAGSQKVADCFAEYVRSKLKSNCTLAAEVWMDVLNKDRM